MKYPSKPFTTLGIFSATILSFLAIDVHAYDMDCKVILCISGGFPAGCSDAYSYMIKRITRSPKPLPPFGFCAMSDGSEFKAHKVNYSYLGKGPKAYDCPAGKELYYRREESESSEWGKETAFCYTHSTTHLVGWGEDLQLRTVYHGQSTATPVNFQLKITIDPGTKHEYNSSLLRINWSTGYVSQGK